MPKRCIAANCSNIACEQVSLFSFPKDEKLRQEWTRQVQRTRADWKGPTATSFVCSDHFRPESFDNLPSLKESLGFKQRYRRLLVPKAIPTEFSRKQSEYSHETPCKRKSSAVEKLERKQLATELLSASQSLSSFDQPECMGESFEDWTEENIHHHDISCQTDFPQVKTQRVTTRNVGVAIKYKGKSKGTQTIWTDSPQKLFVSSCTQTDSESSDLSEHSSEDSSDEEGPPPSEYVRSSSDDSDISEEMDNSNEPTILMALSNEEKVTLHKAKKYIVFFSAILRLISFCTCPGCGHKDLKLSKSELGTMVIITLYCDACGNSTPWHSQPYIRNIPAGNILLSAGTLFAGASVNKIHRVLSHMGVATITPRTFFRHQSDILHKTIRKVWKDQQTSLLAALQEREEKLVCGGDGRADSPGHSAKFGTYTLIELQEKVVLDVELVQSNECGGSYHMEKEGLSRALDVLRDHHLEIDVLITDRHRQIAKFVREDYPSIDHLYDIWHMAKGVKTKLRAIGRKAGCQDISLWTSSIVNHLYWSAVSTPAGQGELIAAKWRSVLDHIHNQHKNFSGVFSECAHGNLEGREVEKKWIAPDSRASSEVEKVINNASFCQDIKKLSGHHQTSLLEAFHSVLIQFAPKMLVFSYEGMLCRVMLAALHYNENSGREQSTSKDGPQRYSLHYPKFKRGGYVVKKVLVPQTFEYVDILMSTVIATLAEGHTDALAPSLEVPHPLNRDFTHPNKRDAVLAHVSRFRTT